MTNLQVRRPAIEVTDAIEGYTLRLDVETIAEVQPMFTIGGSMVCFVDHSTVIVRDSYSELKAKMAFAQ